MFSIGHSNHPLETLLGLLRQHRVQVLVDTRSYPFSKFAPHFEATQLKKAVTTIGMKYLFLGKELGGRPKGSEFYDDDGHVLYSRVAESPLFLDGIKRLETGVTKYRVALLCSEEDPSDCHRRLLVGRVLHRRGILLDHIRGDGRIQTEAELRAEGLSGRATQPSFFDTPKEMAWRSIRSVLQRGRQQSSSER
jgi:uncharacterized protein (DUF488 family)